MNKEGLSEVGNKIKGYQYMAQEVNKQFTPFLRRSIGEWQVQWKQIAVSKLEKSIGEKIIDLIMFKPRHGEILTQLI